MQLYIQQRIFTFGDKFSVYDANGKLQRQESIVDYTKENIRGEYASLDAFIREWRKNPNKWEIRDMLMARGIDLSSMKADQGMVDVDDFDFICHVAYDKKPLTRKERANSISRISHLLGFFRHSRMNASSDAYSPRTFSLV